MTDLIRLDISIPATALADADLLAGILALHVPQGWEEESLATGEMVFRVHTDNLDFLQELELVLQSSLQNATWQRNTVVALDWSLAWKEFFTPVLAGQRFIVLAPWMQEELAASSRLPIIIEPKMAFGTGHHATTALCLELLSNLLDSKRLQPGMRFLDLGTGSGILGIACAKEGLTGLGLDIDPTSVENSLENSTINTVQSKFSVRRGSIDAVLGEQYDLIIANILAQPLQDMAQDIVACLAPSGCLILSGLLTLQADVVTTAYKNVGLGTPQMLVQGDWAALWWE